MAMEAERSKGLHNFSMPRFKWGNQRFLRCVKQQQQQKQDIVAVREKLVVDLKVAADNFKLSILQQEEGNNNNNNDNLDDPNPSKPWNLRRTRRPSCTNINNNLAQPFNQDDNDNNKNNKKVNEKRPSSSSSSFCVSLSKDEIQQDLCTLLGTKPPRRPKKRPRILQKQLDTLFPGLWLTEVTAESYKVSN